MIPGRGNTAKQAQITESSGQRLSKRGPEDDFEGIRPRKAQTMFQVRFHGRGGQGVVTAAELLAGTVGRSILDNIRTARYAGRLYAVNPRPPDRRRALPVLAAFGGRPG